MNSLLSTRTLVLGVALAALLMLGAAAQAGNSSASRSGGSLVGLRKTALGTILVDSRGRTLYLFEKDRKGSSTCDSVCARYWPPLTSKGVARAAGGVRRSLLGLTGSGEGVRQVTYAGHPLYRFIGDKRAGQTTGEGLADFGAEWYAVSAGGHAVERGDTRRSGANGDPSTSSSGGVSRGY